MVRAACEIAPSTPARFAYNCWYSSVSARIRAACRPDIAPVGRRSANDHSSLPLYIGTQWTISTTPQIEDKDPIDRSPTGLPLMAVVGVLTCRAGCDFVFPINGKLRVVKPYFELKKYLD
jgi:hypothetical protein